MMQMNKKGFSNEKAAKIAVNTIKEYLDKTKNKKVLFLELGVGMNTPVIIKYPFWNEVLNNKNSIYVCINFNEAYAPAEIVDRAIIINNDIHKVLVDLGNCCPKHF